MTITAPKRTKTTARPTTKSVFSKWAKQMWPYRYAVTLHVDNLHGGVPNDPNVAQGWLRSRLADANDASDELMQQMVAEVMVERDIPMDEAITEVVEKTKVNGFKFDPEHGLYIEGRQIKAMLKEGASIAVAGGYLDSRGWGTTNKGSKGFLAEHVQVDEDRIYLGRMEPTGTDQQFIRSRHGSSIGYEDYVLDVDIEFHVSTDWNITEKQWAAIWTKAERQGLGASRSQGFGTFQVTRWELMK